jgi:hypothetical protein
MRHLYSFALLLAVLSLNGCAEFTATTPAPDNTIKLVRSPDGSLVALPPDCPDWRTAAIGPAENTPWPQYGCANARNLAAQIARPEDLIQGRDSGPANGETTASSVDRYIHGNTKPLIDPNAAAPTAVATPSGGTGSGGGAPAASGGP